MGRAGSENNVMSDRRVRHKKFTRTPHHARRRGGYPLQRIDGDRSDLPYGVEMFETCIRYQQRQRQH